MTSSELITQLSDARSIRVAATAVLGLLAVFLLVVSIDTATSMGKGIPATNTITVNGTGQATVPPDVARITLTVQNTARTVAEAQAQTTEQVNKVVAMVAKQGVADRDVRTQSYNIFPQYSYPNCSGVSVCPQPTITGYQVSQSVQVTVRDLTKVGDLLGGAGTLGVQNVVGPMFGLDDTTAGYAAARADAIAKAKAQAALLSKQLGVRLGKVVNFYETTIDENGPMPYYGRGGGEMDVKSASSPVVPTGENTYNATVGITYEIR